MLDTWPEGVDEIEIPAQSKAAVWLFDRGFFSDSVPKFTLSRAKAEFLVKISDQLQHAP